MDLQIRLNATDTGLRGALSLRLGDGTSSDRSVEGATCQAVVEALSLTSALALASAPPPSAPSPAPLVTNPAQAASGVTAAPSAASPSVREVELSSSRFGFEAGAQASLGQMVAPHLNVGGGFLARARLERSSVVSPSLTLSVMHTRNELFESSQHAELRLTGLTLAACPLSLRPHRRFRFEPCVSATAAELSATGRELLLSRTVSRSWWGAGALARLSVLPVPDFAVEVEGGGLVPLVSRRFVVDPTRQSLGETPLIAPFASLGLVYAL